MFANNGLKKAGFSIPASTTRKVFGMQIHPARTHHTGNNMNHGLSYNPDHHPDALDHSIYGLHKPQHNSGERTNHNRNFAHHHQHQHNACHNARSNSGDLSSDSDDIEIPEIYKTLIKSIHLYKMEKARGRRPN